VSNNYRLARIDAKTKTITDIADLSIEVKDANEYQTKNKKQNCVTIGVYLLIHPAAGVLLILKVLQGLVMEAEKAKNKTRRNSIKNRKRKSKKSIRKIKRNTIYNLLVII
jgi:hypothetical protein